VTHDQVEAMTMGDRVAVLNKGYLMQVDTPQDLYDRPDNVFVAGFIGSPSMNLVAGRLEGTPEAPVAVLGAERISIDPLAADSPLRDHLNTDLVIGLRPEDLEDIAVAVDAPADRQITATARLVESLGSEIIVHFPMDAPQYIVEDAIDDDAEKGLGKDEETDVYVARLSPRSPVRNGAEITMAVDSSRFHYFDLATGNAIR